jgi:hypothetical protein
MAGLSEHGNGPSGSMKSWEFLGLIPVVVTNLKIKTNKTYVSIIITIRLKMKVQQLRKYYVKLSSITQ